MLTPHDKSRPQVILYSKMGCHLCDDTRELLEEIATQVEFDLTEIDIRSDQALFDLYRYRIPVVLLDGTIIAEGRIDYSDLAPAFRAIS